MILIICVQMRAAGLLLVYHSNHLNEYPKRETEYEGENSKDKRETAQYVYNLCNLRHSVAAICVHKYLKMQVHMKFLHT